MLANDLLYVQVCVEKCPDVSFSGYALAKSGKNTKALRAMKPYCDPYVSGSPDWSRRDALGLVKDGICPAWVLASAPVLGRCMPTADQFQNNSMNPRTVTLSGFKTTSIALLNLFRSKNKPAIPGIK